MPRGTMMARQKKKQGSSTHDIASEHFEAGHRALHKHPMFAPLATYMFTYRREARDNLCPPDGWAVVTANGFVHIHPTRRADPDEWTYVLAHCALHLGFGHLRQHPQPREW